MVDKRDGAVRTVLRGEALRQQLDSHRTPDRVATAAASPQAVASGDRKGKGRLINGVPAAAAVHCCGRGCAHCRIYWCKSDE